MLDAVYAAGFPAELRRAVRRGADRARVAAAVDLLRRRLPLPPAFDEQPQDRGRERREEEESGIAQGAPERGRRPPEAADRPRGAVPGRLEDREEDRPRTADARHDDAVDLHETAVERADRLRPHAVDANRVASVVEVELVPLLVEQSDAPRVADRPAQPRPHVPVRRVRETGGASGAGRRERRPSDPNDTRGDDARFDEHRIDFPADLQQVALLEPHVADRLRPRLLGEDARRVEARRVGRAGVRDDGRVPQHGMRVGDDARHDARRLEPE